MWEVLRAAVVDHASFPGWERVRFHPDEAMRWETVRHLERREPLRLLIRNLAAHGEAPAEVLEAIETIAEILQEGQNDMKRGQSLSRFQDPTTGPALTRDGACHHPPAVGPQPRRLCGSG